MDTNNNPIIKIQKPLLIGCVAVKHNLVMAPMAGITDVPFRALAKEGGAGLVCTEMISAKALTYRDKRTFQMLKLSKAEHPVSVQLFGAQAETIAEAAKFAEDAGADIVDINFGCPVHKVVRTGAGFKLSENETAMTRIMEQTVKAVRIPVTVKIRVGMQKGENQAPRIIANAAQCGVSAVTVHGRAAENAHSGACDLEALRAAARSSAIPVIGNGGITDELSAAKFLNETGVRGLMIGRAAIGDYTIFQRITYYLSTGNVLDTPSWEDRLKALKKHALMSCAHYGGDRGIIHLRKIAPFYLKGMPNASRIRDLFNHVTTLKGLDELLERIWQSPYFGETDEALSS